MGCLSVSSVCRIRISTGLQPLSVRAKCAIFFRKALVHNARSAEKSESLLILDGDWTFVNKNSVDFSRHTKITRPEGIFGCGTSCRLTCTNGPVGMDLDLQLELFQAALDELDLDSNLARVPRNNRLIHQLSRYLPTADSSYFYLLFGHTAGVPVFAR